MNRRSFLRASGAAVATVLAPTQFWLPSEKIAGSSNWFLSMLEEVWKEACIALPDPNEPKYLLARLHAEDMERAFLYGQKNWITKLTPNGVAPLWQMTRNLSAVQQDANVQLWTPAMKAGASSQSRVGIAALTASVNWKQST